MTRITRHGQPDQRFRKGPRPHLWKHGPDPVLQAKQRAYTVMRCQARYRQEPFELSWKDFCRLWEPHWHLRGTQGHAVNLTRIRRDRPWTRSNCRMVSRSVINRESAQKRSK